MTRDANITRPKAVDLFCGAGGMSLGFERAGFDIVLSVDFDPHHVATHKRNFPNGLAWVRSVAELTGAEILDAVGEVDLLFGGPPCQGFSHMGHRNVDDPRNSLVAEYLRVAVELNPKVVVMENVPGLGTGRTKPTLDMAVGRLESAGYLITNPIRTLNALDFGVPQHRERLFLLAVRADISSKPISYPSGSEIRTTVRDALDDLPDISPEGKGESKRPYDKAPAVRYAEIARGQLAAAKDLSYPRIWDSEMCSGCDAVAHSAKTVELYAATRPGTMVPGHRLPRLSYDGYSPTLRAGSSSDHGSYTAPRPVHPAQPRCITPREAARLHGYPDWFEFYPSKWHAYRQIGNSVCPPVAHAVGLEVAISLGLGDIRRPATSLELGTVGKPASNHKNHARIRELDEFPKVLMHLYEDCIASESERRRTTFDVADIEAAVKESGAQLPRIEAENFLSAVARSRNVVKLLRELHECGWTIRADGAGGGEFVPVGTQGGLEERDKFRVSSSDLMSAPTLYGDFDSPIGVLELPEIWKLMRHAGWNGLEAIEVERNLVGEVDSSSLIFAKVDGKRLRLLVLVAEGSRLPKRSQLFTAMNEAALELALVLGRMTSQHLIAVLWRMGTGSALEVARTACKLEPAPSLVGV